MIGKVFLQTTKKTYFMTALLIIAVVVLVGLRIFFYVKSPYVVFLSDRSDAQWIKYDSEFELQTKPASQIKCKFRYTFNTDKQVDKAIITIQALKKFQVFFDGIDVFSSSYELKKWKQIYDIKLPFIVEPGSHEIIINVTSENSYPSVIARSENLPVKTGRGWLVSKNDKDWQMAVPASAMKTSAILKKYPSSFESLLASMPYLAAVFVIVLLISLFASWQDHRMHNLWRLEPSIIRWIMLFLWAMLSFNNMFNLNFQVGFDVWGHLEYLDYLITKRSLPLANEGWEMFQAPLNYILSAPLYALLIKWFDLPSIVKMMVIIPAVCGLLQIEIVYRSARLVFVDRKDLQIITIITGALLPIHTYTCQFVGSEPLGGFFISLVVLLCIPLINPDRKERQSGYYILIGFIWGLALLTKMTAILLAPVLIIVVAFYTKSIKKDFKYFLKSIIITFGISTLIAGWYYLRNYIKMGSPFAGLSEQFQMLSWWQDPGYRTWSQILSFGYSLVWPVYSGVTGFWDMLYSTLWLDGFNSGLVDFIPWNENFMISGALLALLPSFFILISVISVGLNKENFHRNAVIFSIGTIALFVAVMIDHYMVRTAYSVVKASYTLGLLPCYSILVAAGAEPFLRNKIVRSFTLALFACWAFAAYLAYFVISY